MRKEWILLLLLFITAAVNAQYPILQKTTYKPGLYKNVRELRNNIPAYPFIYKIITDTINTHSIGGRELQLLDWI